MWRTRPASLAEPGRGGTRAGTAAHCGADRRFRSHGADSRCTCTAGRGRDARPNHAANRGAGDRRVQDLALTKLHLVLFPWLRRRWTVVLVEQSRVLPCSWVRDADGSIWQIATLPLFQNATCVLRSANRSIVLTTSRQRRLVAFRTVWLGYPRTLSACKTRRLIREGMLRNIVEHVSTLGLIRLVGAGLSV